MLSSSESSSGSASVQMPGAFSAARIVQTKSAPTTQVTTSIVNWDATFKELVSREDKGKAIDTVSNISAEDSSPSSNCGGATRSHGLLTPHASIGEILKEQELCSARISRPVTPSTDSESQHEEIQFATPEGSVAFHDDPDSSNTRGARGSDLNNSPTDCESHASVGVQTSLPYSGSPSCVSTAPPSPTSLGRSASATPKASSKRKRKSIPAYVREGERQSRELDDDLTYLAQEKRRLKHNLARIERSERELKSLLISWPAVTGDTAKDEAEDEATDKGSEAERHARSCARAPLTPVSSEYEKEPQAKSEGIDASISPMATSYSKCSSTSASAYLSANSRLSIASAARGSSNCLANVDMALRGAGYTFAEDSSTTSSVASSREEAQRAYEEAFDLAPNPVHDPSTYLIWFDLETTDAVRPAAKIHILEVAVCITDKNYRYLDKGKSFLVHWPLSAEEIAHEMPQRVREMHEKSGLLSAYASTPPKERLTLPQVERRICKYLERHGIEADRRGIMAGAGVAFDRGMVRQHMEKLDAYFGHQIFDTTTLWHVIRRKYNRTKRFSVTCAHRALDDIMESSREAKLYSELVLKPSGEVHWPTLSHRGI